MKRIVLALLMSACTTSSSSSSPTADTATASAPAPSAPIASASAAPSASAPVVKGDAGEPSSLSFCKGSDFAAEPLLELCAMGQDWSKAHFECKKPLPVNFCSDLVEWGCQYVGPGEKAPKTTFEVRFVRGGVAPTGGEIISDDSLRARFPRAGVVRGVIVNQVVSGKDEGLKVVAGFTKKLVTGGCLVSKIHGSGWNDLDCGSWQASVMYVDAAQQVILHADAPVSPDCTK